MTLAEVSGAAYIPDHLPEGMEPGLEESAFYDPENFVFPFGAHACIVDVDADTGKVSVVRYVAVDDCGPAINPMLIDGQVHGGIVHAIGQALYEQVVYDEDGQLVTGTFVDYALPTAAEVPSFETDRTETPSPVNSLGVKGVGEAGTIAASPAVTNAVIDALRPLGVTLHEHAADPDAGLGCHRRSEGRCVMIPAEFDYRAPETLDEAIRELHENGDEAKLLAGGHSLLPLMKLRLAAPALLIDLRRVPGLHGVQRENGSCPHRGDDHARDGRRRSRPRARGAGRRRRSPTRRSATAARSAARWRTATRPPTCRPSWSPWRGRSPRRAREGSGRSRPPTCSRTT